nr:hypothetical protein [Tanacetum cinerariifolium]
MVVSFPFTVNLYHDGVFQVNPLEYVNFDSKVIDDVSFDGSLFDSMYYKILSDPLIALKLLKTDEDLCSFVKACYENNLKIDLFTEHNGYDIMDMIYEELHPKKHVNHVDSDSDVETNHPLYDVAHVVEQFKHEDESNVNIPKMTTDDTWLNKLVESKFKANRMCLILVSILTHLGMSANRVRNENDHNKLLVFCSRDVSEGKCAAFKSKKPKTVDNEECETIK